MNAWKSTSFRIQVNCSYKNLLYNLFVYMSLLILIVVFGGGERDGKNKIEGGNTCEVVI